MVKKRSEKNIEEKKECCTMYGHHGCKVFLIKIASMAFLLFLLTVWPWLRGVLLGLHWGIYLAIVLLIMLFGMAKYCKKK